MYPIVYYFEGLDFYVRSYWVLVLLGSLAGVVLAARRIRALGILGPRATWGVFAVVCLGGLAGGRLHHVYNSWDLFVFRAFEQGRVEEILTGGFHTGGLVIGLALSAVLVLRLRRVPLGRFGDAATPAFALGMVFGRVACFFHGCCYGIPHEAWWSVRFPKPANAWDYHRAKRLIPEDAEWSAPVHPLQLYFALVALAVFLLSLWLEPRKRYDGQVALFGLLVFSVGNLGLESLREHYALRTYWLGVPQLTWTALAMAVVSGLAIAYAEYRNRRRTLRPVGAAAT